MLLVSEGVVISPPLSSLTLYGGDITPFLEHYGEGGGFPPRGWYPPLVLIWPWATGAEAAALMRVEILDEEEKTGPTLGRVLGA